MRIAAAPSNTLSSAGQPLVTTTDVPPGTLSRHDLSNRQPARNSCSCGLWLRAPATRTIFFSAAETVSEPTARATLAAIKDQNVFIVGESLANRWPAGENAS